MAKKGSKKKGQYAVTYDNIYSQMFRVEFNQQDVETVHKYMALLMSLQDRHSEIRSMVFKNQNLKNHFAGIRVELKKAEEILTEYDKEDKDYDSIMEQLYYSGLMVDRVIEMAFKTPQNRIQALDNELKRLFKKYTGELVQKNPPKPNTIAEMIKK